MIRDILFYHQNQNKIAVIEHGNEVSYHDLILKAAALMKCLPQHSNQNIAIFLPDGADYIAAFWGMVSCGRTVMPLNVLMTEHEIIPLLKQAGADTVITSALFREFFETRVAADGFLLNVIYMDELDHYPDKNNVTAADVDQDEVMVLLNTSGTTGNSKIVKLSALNIESSVLGYLAKVSLTENERDNIRLALAVPFSSVYGIMILAASLIMEIPLILFDQTFTLTAFYQAVEQYQITHYEGSASVIRIMEQMAGRSIPYDISTLRYLGFGGSKISGGSIAKVMRAYPAIEFSQGYGMTEASPLITKRPRGAVGKEESAGTAIKNVRIAVETEAGLTTEPGIIGEILVKGPNVMLGYYNNQAATASILKEGYLHTGDVGYLDDEGFLYICGRIKNTIIIRGFNVYPEEIESCVMNSRLVKDCLVYGRTDDLGNEIVCLDLVPAHPGIGEKDIWDYCRTQLADFKQPRQIFIRETIKKNLSGKTERRNGQSI